VCVCACVRRRCKLGLCASLSVGQWRKHATRAMEETRNPVPGVAAAVEETYQTVEEAHHHVCGRKGSGGNVSNSGGSISSLVRPKRSVEETYQTVEGKYRHLCGRKDQWKKHIKQWRKNITSDAAEKISGRNISNSGRNISPVMCPKGLGESTCGIVFGAQSGRNMSNKPLFVCVCVRACVCVRVRVRVSCSGRRGSQAVPCKQCCKKCCKKCCEQCRKQCCK
jgi:hypothetical protein